MSSSKQRDDLRRQVQDLQEAYPEHEIISDVGSGLNWKRKGFVALLDAVLNRTVDEVVVSHRDRLARFGVEMLEHIFQWAGVQLVVLHPSQDESGEADHPESTELQDDLLAVITFFTARNNGQRSAQHRKSRRRAQESQDEEDPTPA